MAMSIVLCVLWLSIAAMAMPSHHGKTSAALRHRMLHHNHARTPTVTPRAVNVTYVANVTDPSLTRDSCGSTRVGNRVLWTCRDTQLFNNGNKYDMKIQALPITPNSASWTDLNTEGGPKVGPGEEGAGSSGTNPILAMYGGNASSYPSYFPILDTQCPSSGACEDGSRFVIWPNQPPLITRQRSDGSAVGYTWISNERLQGGWNNTDPEPAYILYKSIYSPSDDPDALPTVSVVSQNFFNQGEIGFGRYGSVIKDGIAYLYGQTSTQGTVLARVNINMIEYRSAYQYYDPTSATWTANTPAYNSTSSAILNAGAGGQGTFYYSSYLQSYVWIGQGIDMVGSSAAFYISTAPSPEGPWIAPYLLWEGQNGDNDQAPSYSLQAHPSLLPSGPAVASEKGIYLSWTQQWKEESCSSIYVTPLVWVDFA